MRDYDAEALGYGVPGRSTDVRRRSSLIVRRLVGLVLMIGMAYGIFHVIFRTDILAPVLAYVGPARRGVEWVFADPRRAWMALAAIVIPHIGLYYLIFEDRK